MKRIISLLMLILITTFLCSCNKGEKSINEPDYSAFARRQSADSRLSVDADSKSNTIEIPSITYTPDITFEPISQELYM
ncbi:MAG: hypothetical protein GX757_01485 [Clostridiales bacterium]|nr:hypothetical protein [Clostridiales bacterium]